MTARLVMENLRHRPLRTGLSVFLIGVPVTLILTLAGLSRGMLEDSARRSRGVGADIIVRPPGTSAFNLSGAPLPEGIVRRLAEEPHVVQATGVLVHFLPPFTSVNGVDWEAINLMSGGFRFLEGGPFQGPYDVIVDQFYARERNVHAGDRVDIMNRDWRVAGVIEPGKLARVMAPLATMQDLTASSRRISQVYLKLESPSHIPKVKAALKALPGLENYPIYSVEELATLVSVSNIPQLNAFINVVVAISVVIGFAVVFLSMYTAVLQRTREIGIMKSLGASRWMVLRIILTEALLLGLAGTILGVLLAYGSRWLVFALAPASLTQAIVPAWWPRAGLIALVAALFGALYPGVRAARQDPVEALAYE
ncbi:MAG: ABC transporter permease [Acidobacteria bacterium]|nr:ABC transporter permease [Acidobacteriota bacterium]